MTHRPPLAHDRSKPPSAGRRVVALTGGVGGARLLHGLAGVLPPRALTAVVNTGDDFTHWGLRICPDLDTVMYTLAGLSHEQRGWGLARETFHALDAMRRYGAEGWFQLGDRDLATHLFRTDALASGRSLTEATAQMCQGLQVRTRVLPMCDQPRATMIDTRAHGTLAFQDWLVRERSTPGIERVRFEGAPEPGPDVVDAIERADLVVICPSNPYVSIDPILALAGVREALSGRPVIAVSPIVRGRAVKGPLAQMIADLEGRPASARAALGHYGELLNAVVVEAGDEAGFEVPALGAATVMGGRADRERLARDVLDFAERHL
ncbi:MAG: 2-phospho-L-lactate transferase [Myxococcales bacterium]|nr:2-phospho-L-lactate transferase [Myxococcales bacterium]